MEGTANIAMRKAQQEARIKGRKFCSIGYCSIAQWRLTGSLTINILLLLKVKTIVN